jgi:hypothetical protein
LGLTIPIKGLALALNIRGLALGSVGGPNLGSARDSVKDDFSFTFKAVVLGVVAIFWPVIVGVKFKSHVMQNLHRTIYFILSDVDLLFANLPRSSLHTNKKNRISTKMTVFTDTKGALLRAIKTIARPYADATATT